MDSNIFQKTVSPKIYFFLILIFPHLERLIYVILYMCMSLCGLTCVPVCLHVCVVVVAKRGDPVTLTCTTKTDGAVTWKFEDDEIDIDDNIQADGKNLAVSEVADIMLGEYTCWRGNQKLSSTHLLMEADEGEEFGKIFLIYSTVCTLYMVGTFQIDKS